MTRAAIFDIGGVLVDWRPHEAWLEDLGSPEAVLAFMDRVDFKARNARADGGERFADLATELDEPEDRRRLANYVSLYARTVQKTVPGTWDVLDRLVFGDVAIHAITNWSAETWAEGLKVHPRLAEVFGTTIVSGIEGVKKPDPAIFGLLCDRTGLAAADCVFIDDGLHNVEGARAVGMTGLHFTGAAALERDLVSLGLL